MCTEVAVKYQPSNIALYVCARVCVYIYVRAYVRVSGCIYMYLLMYIEMVYNERHTSNSQNPIRVDCPI